MKPKIPKSLAHILSEIYEDDDGWWAVYQDGWSSDSGAHCEHEETRKKVIEAVKQFGRVCKCQDCLNALTSEKSNRE